MPRRIRSLWDIPVARMDEVVLDNTEWLARQVRSSAYFGGMDATVTTEFELRKGSIHSNAWTTFETNTGRQAQAIANIGFSRPTYDQDIIKGQIIHDFEAYILPRLTGLTRVDIMVGTLMGLEKGVASDSDGSSHGAFRNVKYYRPDFNSRVVSLMIEKHDPPATMTHLEDLIAGVDLATVTNSDGRESDSALLAFTNALYRLHFSREPLVGSDRPNPSILPDRLFNNRKAMWTPVRNVKRGQVCFYHCLDKALGGTGRNGAVLCKQYMKYYLTIPGIDPRFCPGPKYVYNNGMGKLDQHASHLEDYFNIRLNIYVYQDDAKTLTHQHIHTRALYLTKRKPEDGRQNVSILIAGNHAHWLKDPALVLLGHVCADCGRRYKEGKDLKKHHLKRDKKQGICTGDAPRIIYKGAPYGGPLHLMDSLEARHGPFLSPGRNYPRRNAFVVWRASIDDKGHLLAISAACHDPDRRFGEAGFDGIREFNTGSENAIFHAFYSWLLRMRTALINDFFNTARTTFVPSTFASVRKNTRDYHKLLEHFTGVPVVGLGSGRLDFPATKGLWQAYMDQRHEPTTSLEVNPWLICSGCRYLMAMTRHAISFVDAANYLPAKQSKWEWLGNDLLQFRDMCAGLHDELGSIDSRLELFRGNFTMGGLARAVGYGIAAKEGAARFFMPKGQEEGERITGIFKRNLAGGPSVVYARRVDDASVFTYDATALYAWAMRQDMPVGSVFFEFTPDGAMKQHGTLTKTSIAERAWLDQVLVNRPDVLRQSEQPASRMRIKGKSGVSYIPDALCRETREVWEFLGEYFHNRNSEVRAKTDFKLQDMREAGYRVHVMWEMDFLMKGRLGRRLVREKQKEIYPPFAYANIIRNGGQSSRHMLTDGPRLTQHLLDSFKPKEGVDWSSALQNTAFGFVECDLEVDKDHADMEALGDFPPLFVRDENGRLSNPQDGTEQRLFFTPYLAVLVSLGFRVTRVHRFWEFQRGSAFRTFIDRAMDARGRSKVWKLLANAFYGSTLMDPGRYTATKMTTDDAEISEHVRNSRFAGMTCLNQGSALFALSRKKTRVLWNIPLQLGKATLDYAKGQMALFYHRCLRPNLGPLRLISHDTDAFTFAISGRGKSLADHARDRNDWMQRVEPAWFGKKPGQFHLEAKGSSCRVAGPKLFCVVDDNAHPVKVAHRCIPTTSLPADPSRFMEQLQNGDTFEITEKRRHLDPSTGRLVLVDHKSKISGRL